MQAITTRYLGPTNFRGSRVKATCQAGSITAEWNDAFNSESNHSKAAQALAMKLGWHGAWYGGGMHDGSWAFVCCDSHFSANFTVEKRK